MCYTHVTLVVHSRYANVTLTINSRYTHVTLSQVTMSTIGYGDLHPESQESQLIVIFIIGIGLVSRYFKSLPKVPTIFMISVC